MSSLSEKTRPTEEKSGAAKIATRAGRILLIVLLIWAGITTGGALKTLFSSEAAQAPQVVENDAFPQMPAVTIEMLRGRWEVTGMPVSIELLQTDESRVDAILTQAPADNEIPFSVANDLSVMINQFKSRMAVLATDQDVRVYGMDEPSARVRMYCRNGGGTDHLLGGNVAVPRGDGNWMVVMLRGCVPQALTVDHQEFLTTLPNGSQRVAARRNADGTLQCEIVQLNGGLEQASLAWQQAGWKVNALPVAKTDPNSFQLTRGSEIVQVHVLAAPGTPSDYVLFVRSPQVIR
ncbi:hypothetical protein Pan258_32520 [Symmachiella dynata]|uniref:hypothetical protein n=1 Tax=Symmachiella dynata TaxID=2527995 RepID=UPI00118AB51C|nr:hypothetical protein [Symmachiella dynata]QDT49205.1 hypothetical protein Pan258_32520 [Symmachiella dynata]